jgi:DNA polymerase elongation subunit (family B)/predicted RNA-binding Zn-ribbon protein involved in translation (DUF1610 family)
MESTSNPSGMKVLVLDIETTPHDAYTWGLWQQNIGLNMLKDPTRMMAWAAKWEGDEYVYSAHEGTHDRLDMILEVYDMVNEADAIVHYNGTAFDMKHLHREFVEQELPPPLKYKNIDLLRVVKQMFKFPSNKLDYVAKVLLGEEKFDTGGFELWTRCLAGDKDAWLEMERYNIQDVLLTEKLYYRLQGWIPAHPNRALWIDDQENPTCPNCGSTNMVRKGLERPARVNAYQRYKCNDCGANARGRTVAQKAGPGVLR